MAERKNFLIPECYVDTNILKTLFRLDGVNHQHCCSKVMKCMSLKFSEGFAVGVVDDDKRKASGSEDFVELAQSPHLIMMKHKSRMHFLFFVHKAAEDFLLSCAREQNINMDDFGLPDDLEGLKMVTKNIESDKEPRIRKLVNALRDSSEMARLQRSIDYLLEKQYQTDIKELVRLFNQ